MAIPLPDVTQWGDFSRGLQSGGNLFQQLMQPVMNQRNLQMQQMQMQQQQEQFMKNLALKQQQHDLNAQLFPFQRDLLQAQTGQAQANALKGQVWANLLSGDQPQNAPWANQNNLAPQNANQSISMGENAKVQPPMVPGVTMDQSGMGKTIVIDPGNPQLSGFDRVAGMNGVPQVQTHYDTNGNLVSRYPSGKVTITRVGPQAGEKKQSEAIGKFQGESYGKAVETSQGLAELKSSLDRLVDDLEKYPNPEQVIGPINSQLTKFFGNPQDQALLGDILSTGGNIVLDAAKSIKGAFTGRDQNLINTVKLNVNDPYFVALGKLKAQGELTEMAKKRADIYADLLHQGVPPHQALKVAQERTNIEPITNKYQKLLKNAQNKSSLAEGKMPSFASQEEAKEFLSALSVSERIKFLNKVGR